jgi:hypothetical protein
MREGEEYRASASISGVGSPRNGWRTEFHWVETVGDQLAGWKADARRRDRRNQHDAGAQERSTSASRCSTQTSGDDHGPGESPLEAFSTLFSPHCSDLRLHRPDRDRRPRDLAGAARDLSWPDGYLRGVWGASGWRVTLVTSDVSDLRTRRVASRVVALLWIFFAVLIIAYFTAVATST